MRQLSDLVAELRALGAVEVYLHGSVAKGTPRPDSDVDLFCVVASEEARRAIDRAYFVSRPLVLVDGVARRADILTESTTRTNDPALFRKMSPEARRLEKMTVIDFAAFFADGREPSAPAEWCALCRGAYLSGQHIKTVGIRRRGSVDSPVWIAYTAEEAEEALKTWQRRARGGGVDYYATPTVHCPAGGGLIVTEISIEATP